MPKGLKIDQNNHTAPHWKQSHTSPNASDNYLTPSPSPTNTSAGIDERIRFSEVMFGFANVFASKHRAVTITILWIITLIIDVYFDISSEWFLFSYFPFHLFLNNLDPPSPLVLLPFFFLVISTSTFVYFLFSPHFTTLTASTFAYFFLVHIHHGLDTKGWALATLMVLARSFLTPTIPHPPRSPSLRVSSHGHTLLLTTILNKLTRPIAAHCTGFGLCWLSWRIMRWCHDNTDWLLVFFGLQLPLAPKVTLRGVWESSLALSWHVNATETTPPVTRYIVELEGILSQDVERQETFAVITDLAPDQVYRVRVWSVASDHQWRASSDWITARTLANKEAPRVPDVPLNPQFPRLQTTTTPPLILPSVCSPSQTSPETQPSAPGITQEELNGLRDELKEIRAQREEMLLSIAELKRQHERHETELRGEMEQLRETRRVEVDEPRNRLRVRLRALEDSRRDLETNRTRHQRDLARDEAVVKKTEDAITMKEKEIENFTRSLKDAEEAMEGIEREGAEKRQISEEIAESRGKEVEEAKGRLVELIKQQNELKDLSEQKQDELKELRLQNEELEKASEGVEDRQRRFEKECQAELDRLSRAEEDHRALQDTLRTVTREKMSTMEELNRYKKWKEDQDAERKAWNSNTGSGGINPHNWNSRQVENVSTPLEEGLLAMKKRNVGDNTISGTLGGSIFPTLQINGRLESPPYLVSPIDLQFPITAIPASTSTNMFDLSKRRASFSAAPVSQETVMSNHSNSSSGSSMKSLPSPQSFSTVLETLPLSPVSPITPETDFSDSANAVSRALSPLSSLNGVPLLRPAPTGSLREQRRKDASINLLDAAPGPPRARSASVRRGSINDINSAVDFAAPLSPKRLSGQSQPTLPLISRGGGQQSRRGGPPTFSSHSYGVRASSSLFEFDPLGEESPSEPVIRHPVGRARSSSNPVSPTGADFFLPPAIAVGRHNFVQSSGAAKRRDQNQQHLLISNSKSKKGEFTTGPGSGEITSNSPRSPRSTSTFSEYNLYRTSPIISSSELTRTLSATNPTSSMLSWTSRSPVLPPQSGFKSFPVGSFDPKAIWSGPFDPLSDRPDDSTSHLDTGPSHTESFVTLDPSLSPQYDWDLESRFRPRYSPGAQNGPATTTIATFPKIAPPLPVPSSPSSSSSSLSSSPTVAAAMASSTVLQPSVSHPHYVPRLTPFGWQPASLDENWTVPEDVEDEEGEMTREKQR